MNLTITDIKSYPVWVGHRNQMLVKVETHTGYDLMSVIVRFICTSLS